MTMDTSYTAHGAYGFTGWTTAQPGGMAVMPETQVGVSGDIPGPSLPKLPLNWHNPIFWFLVLGLTWSGYVYGSFDVGLKKIGRSSLKLGS